jgi:DNA-binding HxlR family transcriptional regulator
MPNEQTFSHETTALVIRSLEQSARPLSNSNFKRAIPKSAQKDLPELLRQLVQSGEIRSGKARSSIVYWQPALEEQAAQRILEALDDRPLTQTELKNKFRSLLIGWPQIKCLEIVEQLIKERRVYKVVPLTGKARLLSTRSQATTQDYVKLALQLAITKLAKRGIRSEEVLAAAQEVLLGSSNQSETVPPPSAPPTQIDLPQLILDRMFHLNSAAATGALVSLSELRHALQVEIPGKTDFDREVLQLAEQGRVALHRHDYVSSLSQAERDALVLDQSGNHFIGIAVRI